jgi:endoglucanase
MKHFSAPQKVLILLFISLLFLCSLHAKVTLREIRTAADNVIVMLYTSDTMDINEVDISNREAWKINGKPVQKIFLYATNADKCDHHVYLSTEKLVQGERYTLVTPFGENSFVFNDRDILCESIKTNQAGYSALSHTRYANFAIWLGTGGSQKIESPLPDYQVYLPTSGEVIAKGKLIELGSDVSSGDYVYRIDLSKVPEGGPYKIVVTGFGSSYPFGVGSEFSRRLAYITFRGQYLQRCGCPIEKPAIRKKACHTLIYDADGSIGEANVVVKGDEPTFRCYGGYHDAGDADRRAYHLINPILDLMIYEAFPGAFSDGQFDIPGKFDEEYNILSYTNDIPDLLDEAAWGTLVWEYLQNDDGSVHFGTETKGYPDPFDAPMDQDTKKYGTVRIDPRATCTSAGLFLHLARLIKSFDAEKSDELAKRAEKSMAYGEKEMADPEKLYFYIQKYLLTGDEFAHHKVKELYTIADSLKFFLFQTQGYSLNDIHFDDPAYFYSYIIEKKRPTDKVIVDFFIKALKEAADSNIAILKAHAYPVGNNSAEGGWGHNVRQPQYASIPLLYWNLTKEQKYFDAASELMDWKLGLNPMGICYVTGLGFQQVHNPHDRESAYTKKLGWGPKPGITVFGPGIEGRWWKPQTIPSLDEMPAERLYADDLRAIYYNEFTIFETMQFEALYTILAGEGKWDGNDPYESNQGSPGK